MSFVLPMILKSMTYTEIMQKLVEDLLMNTHRQSSLLKYHLFSRNFSIGCTTFVLIASNHIKTLKTLQNTCCGLRVNSE
jgi:hypothetical protein